MVVISYTAVMKLKILILVKVKIENYENVTNAEIAYLAPVF